MRVPLEIWRGFVIAPHPANNANADLTTVILCLLSNAQPFHKQSTTTLAVPEACLSRLFEITKTQ